MKDVISLKQLIIGFLVIMFLLLICTIIVTSHAQSIEKTPEELRKSIYISLELEEVGYHVYNTVVKQDYITALDLIDRQDNAEIVDISTGRSNNNVYYYMITYKILDKQPEVSSNREPRIIN